MIRFIDIFLTGPLQILVGTYVENIYLKIFMLLTGSLTIIYNYHNLLLFNNIIDKPLPPFDIFVTQYGKTQTHRLYNLLFMYPIFYYVYQNTKLPSEISYLFLINIILGFLYNSFYYTKHLQ